MSVNKPDVIASEAKQSRAGGMRLVLLDCFVGLSASSQ
jgi:hypothetical protein